MRIRQGMLLKIDRDWYDEDLYDAVLFFVGVSGDKTSAIFITSNGLIKTTVAMMCYVVPV
jgi:hypothetical protein